MDFAADGLLDGLEGDARRAREQLLVALSEAGFSPEELRSAAGEDRLVLLPLLRVLGASYTAREISEQTGLPVGLMLRIRRLAGLPDAGADDRVFAEDDIALAQSTRTFLDAGLSEESIAEITRVLGECMSRTAAASTAAFANAFLQPGDSEVDVAFRFAQAAEHLIPHATPLFTAAFKAHLRESVLRAMLGQDEIQAGHIEDQQDVAVCFADLVGFTRLGGEIEVRELGTVAGALAQLATEVVVPPARLVKTIGDAALYVSPDPGTIVGVALSLVEAVEEADLPSLRAGIAYGPALIRAGDFFGHSVNLASRVTGVARPGSVLCTAEIRDAAHDHFDWSAAGRHRLKGVAEPVPLYRARRLESGADSTAEPVRKRRADRSRRRASS